MAFVKTGLSIDKQLFKKADEIASKLDISRSKLYQLALEDYIRQYDTYLFSRPFQTQNQMTRPIED
jgi:metal-responsive CopG/Arc/MetJ family transcriptional regulator